MRLLLLFGVLLVTTFSLGSDMQVAQAEEVKPRFKTLTIDGKFAETVNGQSRLKDIGDLLMADKFTEARKEMDSWEAAAPNHRATIQEVRKAADTAEKETDLNKRKFWLASALMGIDPPAE